MCYTKLYSRTRGLYHGIRMLYSGIGMLYHGIALLYHDILTAAIPRVPSRVTESAFLMQKRARNSPIQVHSAVLRPGRSSPFSPFVMVCLAPATLCKIAVTEPVLFHSLHRRDYLVR